jgi:NitT/TauT family transport system substrate-binding protein
MTVRSLALALASAVVLAGCGGAAAPASSPAAPGSPVAASAKPAASAGASAKPPAGASAKPAASGSAASAKPAASGGGAATSMTVAYVGVSGGDLPLWTADDEGIFKKNGLDVKVTIATSSSSGMIADLIAGQLQVVWTDGTNAVAANANGADLQIIAMIHPEYGYLMMAPASIKTPADLKGKKIAVSNLTGTDAVATKEALPKLGLTPQDVTFVPVSSNANRTAALLSGAAQATMLDPPGTLQLEAQGFHAIADTTTMNLPSTNASLNVSRAYAASHHDAVQKFIDSIVEGIALDKKDRAKGIAILKKHEKSDDDKAMQTTYDFYNPITPSLPFPKLENLTNAVDQLSAENPKLKTVDLAKVIDASYVQSAADRKLDKS